MSEAPETELVEIGDLDAEQWNDYAEARGWSDGLPLVMPTEAAVERLTRAVHGDNEPFAPISPRQVVPSVASLAANAVMAGCRPHYFPAVLAALRGVLDPEYNLHGTLATTHPCAPMVLVSGPARAELGVNCAGNCFGQGTRANAAIGRALALILLNVGGATPGVMDRSTQGSPAKFAYCFGENEAESPWEPYHVRRGFAPSDSVVTVMAGEAPHNINDHGSTTGEGLMRTICSTVSQPGANTIYGHGPFFVVLGPEHAETLHRDRFTIAAIQERIFVGSRVHVSRVSEENQASYIGMDHHPVDDHFSLTESPEDIHILVAGGPGKHSAFIPSFGGTAAVSVRIRA